MKKLKVFLLIITILLITNITAFGASYEMYADKLSTIGVFKGTENGYELERQPTRLEGLIMLIRLLGKEAEALKMSQEPSAFTDVPDWGRGYVNYAYKNNLTKGLGNGLFGSNDVLNGKSYITFLLRALGYSDTNNADFSWDNAVLYGRTIGLLNEEILNKINSSPFIRDYVAKTTYDTLQFQVKDANNTLLEKLVVEGVVSKEEAQNLLVLNQEEEKKLTAVEIGELSKGVVMLQATGYDDFMWSGSGFYIDSNGSIVTNFLLVDGAKSIEVMDDDGSIYNGKVTVQGYDDINDLALIRIDKKNEFFLEIGDSDNIKLGEEIYTIGSALGLSNTLSNGIISSNRKDLIQISAPISRGSRGGALINDYGKVVGVILSGYTEGENIGFAVPINIFESMPKDLSYSLDDLYNNVTYIEKPTNVTLTQIGAGSISIYWDSIPEADYYRVFVYDNSIDKYYLIVDENGSDKWHWYPDSCLEYGGFDENETVYISVTAVRGNGESEFAEVANITLSSQGSLMTLEEMGDYLISNNSNLYVDDKSILIDNIDVDISDNNDTIFISIFLSAGLNDFLVPFNDNRSELTQTIADLGTVVMYYYGIDTMVSVIYSRPYPFYPSAFESNNLYPNTVSYHDDFWFVFYPYVEVEMDYINRTYDAYWAY